MDILSISLNIGILVISAFVITKAINLFIDSSSKLAHLLNLSEYTISFLLISIATSLPELVVAITSGIEKNSILSYGDAIGSNLALLTLITALPILLGNKISTRDVIRSKDAYYGAFFLVLALALAVDGMLTRIDGIILLVCYVIYTRSMLKKETLLESLIEKFEHTNVWKQGVIFVVSLILLLAASEGIVQTALNLSKDLGISLGYIGLTVTAIGTSLPEVAFVLGIKKNHGNEDEILGDVLGSVVANSTLVLGTAATIYPINLAHSTLGFPTILLLISTLLLFLMFSRSGEELDKKEALTLLSVYILFLAVEYILII